MPLWCVIGPEPTVLNSRHRWMGHLIDMSLRERNRMVVRGSPAYQDSNGNLWIKSAEQMQKISPRKRVYTLKIRMTNKATNPNSDPYNQA